ncbi:hypothetical protein [Halobacterium yunchengense]|uniref:hypothetical protein n=1 Tax=Halobacterium yunchengense TaxID=3108497 RepID=UPI00300A531A
MNFREVARNAALLVALAAAAAVAFLAVQSALVAAGAPEAAAYPAAVGAVLPPVLAFADAFTPFGNSERTAALGSLPRERLAADGALAAAVGGVVGGVGGALFLAGDATSLAELGVLSAAVVAGYVTFVARNLEVYGGARGSSVDPEEVEP